MGSEVVSRSDFLAHTEVVRQLVATVDANLVALDSLYKEKLNATVPVKAKRKHVFTLHFKFVLTDHIMHRHFATD